MYDELVKRLRNAAQWSDKGLVITPSICLEAAEAIEELSKENESLGNSLIGAVEMLKKKRKPKWIPVTERLPEKPGNYLVYANYAKGNLPFVDVDYYSGKNFATVYTCCGYYRVSHWMPLPEPPEEEK